MGVAVPVSLRISRRAQERQPSKAKAGGKGGKAVMPLKIYRKHYWIVLLEDIFSRIEMTFKKQRKKLYTGGRKVL